MKQRYQVADSRSGGNVIIVTITVEDDSSLTVYDLSYGPIADQWWGEGRDVEVWLKISPEEVNRLANCLLDREVEDPAGESAQLLAAIYKDDTTALRRIQGLLDQHEIQYSEMVWP